MKIIYDHSIFQNQQFGGISRYFYELIRRMSPQDNIEVNLFQGLHVNEYDLSTDTIPYNSYAGLKPKIKLSSLIRSHLFIIPNKIMFDVFYKTSEDIDVYHPTYYYQGIKRHHKAPIVLTVYDMIHELYPKQLRYSKYTIKAKKASIEAADKIICISNNTKKDLMEIHDFPEDKIEVIHLASSLKKMDNPINVTSLHGIDKPYLLYVGDRKGAYKNFITLLEAFTSTLKNDYELVCFGGGPFNKDELNIIDRTGCRCKVTQLSGSDHLLASLYQNAFAFVCPSHYEGFGLPLIEAMGCGCPVIAANTSSIPEVVGNAGILFDPNHKEDLIEAIESLGNGTVERKELIATAFKRESKFSWDKTAKETLKVYEDIAQ